jgi:hypothetical protein
MARRLRERDPHYPRRTDSKRKYVIDARDDHLAATILHLKSDQDGGMPHDSRRAYYKSLNLERGWTHERYKTLRDYLSDRLQVQDRGGQVSP